VLCAVLAEVQIGDCSFANKLFVFLSYLKSDAEMAPQRLSVSEVASWYNITPTGVAPTGNLRERFVYESEPDTLCCALFWLKFK